MAKLNSLAQEEGTVVQDIISWLRERSYTAEEAVSVAGRLHAHRELWLALRGLVEKDRPPRNLAVGGISYEQLMKIRWMTPINALLILASAKTDPKAAKEVFQRGIR